MEKDVIYKELKINDFDSILNDFENLDMLSNLYIFKYTSLKLYKAIKKELYKRNTNFRIEDFNYLFFYNISIFKGFIKNFYVIGKNNHKNFKSLKLNTSFVIKDYEKLSDIEKFNKVFDVLLLSNPNVNHLKYEKYFKIKRAHLDLNAQSIKALSYNNIKKYNLAKKFNVDTKFYVKRKKNQLVNIYILDLTLEEFDYIFKALSYIFNNCYYKVHIINNICNLNNLCDNKDVNVFVTYNSDVFKKANWINKNRYVLSKENFYYDLFSLLNDNPNILELSKNMKKYKLSERKSIYNKTYFVSNRIKKFIDLIEKEVN